MWCFSAKFRLARSSIKVSATEEIKLDGYRAVAAKSDRGVRLFSRHNKSFNNQYPDIVEALGRLSENTVDA